MIVAFIRPPPSLYGDLTLLSCIDLQGIVTGMQLFWVTVLGHSPRANKEHLGPLTSGSFCGSNTVCVFPFFLHSRKFS